VWQGIALSLEQDRRLVDQFRHEADQRYGEIGRSAQAIRDALLRGRRPGARGRPPPQDTLSHALRQLRGLERALRLEHRRDYFRAPGRAIASSTVETIIAELGRLASATQKEESARALGH
jgi:hypothetical protein